MRHENGFDLHENKARWRGRLTRFKVEVKGNSEIGHINWSFPLHCIHSLCCSLVVRAQFFVIGFIFVSFR